ncbi:hypothetical protein DDB_G0269844 [Dictyostelium discoideum AX4]|uniref:Uncharacterized protein n=1 Tax=Dictyostelium discoideum TaxID=44689 RepID=Q55CZ4_DICDI|nr:hypothetical protein DDB_G0269844 [Dictyostelium discoideum AX4]EAL72272.1 hypothetical protein DDB_G0269844 [Dictyostelium discoideum AX4]|eukprot:XP_646337.1 hypothetical protein DDB_G0269844 [Dictyostelium discoideum AX4]
MTRVASYTNEKISATNRKQSIIPFENYIVSDHYLQLEKSIE